jgi:hypothetical protein
MYTNFKGGDGFGAQYQRIIETYIYCKLNNKIFLYRPFTNIEHNYENDSSYNDKLETLINLKNNISNDNESISQELDFLSIVCQFFENNIEKCCESEHMGFIKKCFWENKDRNYFKNNKTNVSIHIRRDNPHDMGKAGERIITPNSYYLNIINEIRSNNKDKELQFHIYSQGNINNFSEFISDDTVFHINENIIDTFTGLVAADILITSPSSFSYTAALISDGKIYYKKFWHKPKDNWIVNSS